MHEEEVEALRRRPIDTNLEELDELIQREAALREAIYLQARRDGTTSSERPFQAEVMGWTKGRGNPVLLERLLEINARVRKCANQVVLMRDEDRDSLLGRRYYICLLGPQPSFSFCETKGVGSFRFHLCCLFYPDQGAAERQVTGRCDGNISFEDFAEKMTREHPAISFEYGDVEVREWFRKQRRESQFQAALQSLGCPEKAQAA